MVSNCDLTQNPKTKNQKSCLKNATNTNKEQGKHRLSQKQNKQNDQNLKRKNKKKMTKTV